MTRAWTTAALLALASSGRAADDQPHPLALEVGQSVSICKTGTIQCPAGGPFCDDPKVAVPADGPDGLAFRAVGVGSTLCSAGSAGGYGARRLYRITVTPAGEAPRPAAPRGKPAQGGER